MTCVRAALWDYLAIRRRLGFEMPQDGRLLEQFVEFLEQPARSGSPPSWHWRGRGNPRRRTRTPGGSGSLLRGGSPVI